MKSEPLKPPIELVRKGDETQKTLAYACGTCGWVLAKDLAASCCATHWCDCGNEIKKPYTACTECRKAAQSARTEARKAKATKVKAVDYDGPVYWDDADRYYADVDEAAEDILEYVALDGIDANAQTVYACSSMHLVLDADDILYRALEDSEHHEDAYDQISSSGVAELRDFLTKWNATYGVGVTSWWVDEKKLIVLEFSEEELREAYEEYNGTAIQGSEKAETVSEEPQADSSGKASSSG